MQPNSPIRIAIIGAGASGTLLTVQLCRLQTNRQIDIYLIDKQDKAGKGLAYSTDEPLHLLNVTANKISALPDEPEHFVLWLQRQNLPFAAPDFVPRGIYGRYLTDLLKKSLEKLPSNINFCQAFAEALSIDTDSNQISIHLSGGSIIVADKVVLALGNFPPGHPCSALALFSDSALYAPDPWKGEIYDDLGKNDPVLLVGSGLTMVDMVMTLYTRKHTGKIVSVSTNGHLPSVHAPSASYANISEEAAELKTVSDWLPFIRQHIRQAVEQGLCWRSVIDAFRPYSQSFWLNLSVEEKRRFMRHMRHIWAVSRHRMPPLTAGIIDNLIQSGQLEIQDGKITDAKITGNEIIVTITRKKESNITFSAGKIINCTGPESDYRKVKSALIQDLLQKGYISPDPLFLGLAASPDGRLIGKNQQISDILFSMGPPLKGMLWESTAIPEIRTQAKALAEILTQ